MSRTLKTTKELAKLGGYSEDGDVDLYPAACGVLKATIDMFLFWVEECNDYESLMRHVKTTFERITDDF